MITDTKIIAEIGWNHQGNMFLAKHMIEAAKISGADFVKGQIWSVSRLKDGPWDKDGRRQIYEGAELTYDRAKELYDYSNSIGIRFFASVFSVPDAETLKNIDNNYVKIASAEARNYELLDYVNKHFNTIIISSGTLTEEEIKEMINHIDEGKLILLHCISTYPCLPDLANLPKLHILDSILADSKHKKNIRIGYSDHCEGIQVAMASLEYEICIIEKHFTTNQTLPGRDNKFSILPKDLKELRAYIEMRNRANIFHSIDYLPQEKEQRELYSGRWNKR